MGAAALRCAGYGGYRDEFMTGAVLVLVGCWATGFVLFDRPVWSVKEDWFQRASGGHPVCCTQGQEGKTVRQMTVGKAQIAYFVKHGKWGGSLWHSSSPLKLSCLQAFLDATPKFLG